MKKEVKKKKQIVIAFLLGGIVFGSIGVYATVKLSSSEISYDNKLSGIKATTVKGAIDELYEKANSCENGSSADENFVVAYTYNQTKGSSDYCITGEESTCKKSTCYKTKTANSCKAGDIIKYNVNDTYIITFHVMYDNGETLTMQSQKNTIKSADWYSSTQDSSKGPLTVLRLLENATASWSNVNNQTYTMGQTIFKDNAYTGCSSYNNCNKNIYTLAERTAKARMITLQEAVSLGCTSSWGSCPKWMYTYLSNSTQYGGTDNDTESKDGYWTMSTIGTGYSWRVYHEGNVVSILATNLNAARAVVVVSK